MTTGDPISGMLDLYCRELKLPGLRAGYPAIARDAVSQGQSYPTFLAACLASELASRREHRLTTRRAQARFPVTKTIETFDFAAMPQLSPTLIRTLAEGTTLYKLRTYLGPSVLVIDELGYLPMDQHSANWIFQIVSRRYDKGSIILTGNRGFGDWGQIFADQVVAGAIVDRLLHKATVLNIRGKSYRIRAHQPLSTEGGAAIVR